MKLFALAALLGLLLTGCSSVGPAAEVPDDHWSREPAAVPLMRIGRGVTNVAISPLELPTTMWRVAEEYDEFGYGAGVFQGLFNAGHRLIWGVGEVCTFFFIHNPDPAYDRPLGERIIPSDNYQPADMSAASGGATKPGRAADAGTPSSPS